MHVLIALLIVAGPESWERTRSLAIQARERGAYAESESLSLTALGIAERSGNPNATSVCLTEVGVIYKHVGRIKEAISVFQRALDLDQQAVDRQTMRPGERLPNSLNNLAAAYVAEGRNTEAEAIFARALKIAESGPEGRDYITTIVSNRASLLIGMGRQREASALLESALQKDEGDGDTERTASLLSKLALSKKMLGEYAVSETLNRRALRIRENLPVSDPSAVANSLNNLGSVLQSEWRFEEAESALRRSIEISRVHQKEAFQPSYAAALSNLATVYTSVGRVEEAEVLLKEALAVATAQFGERSWQTATPLSGLARAYEVAGQPRKAERLFLEAMQILRTAPGANPSDYAAAHGNLASIYMAERKYEKAELLYRRALEIDEAVLGPSNARVGADIGNLATALEGRRNFNEAERLFLKSSELLADKPEAATVFMHLGSIYARQSKLSEAVSAYRRALELWPQRGAGANDPMLIPVLQQYAAVERKLENFASAEAAETRALGILVARAKARDRIPSGNKSFLPAK